MTSWSEHILISSTIVIGLEIYRSYTVKTYSLRIHNRVSDQFFTLQLNDAQHESICKLFDSVSSKSTSIDTFDYSKIQNFIH